MRKAVLSIRSLLLAATLLPIPLAAQTHTSQADFDLNVSIDPATHELEVHATIEVPASYAGQTLEFLLTNAVEIVQAEPAVRRLPYDDRQGFTGINGSSVELTQSGHTARYEVKLPPGDTTLHISYRGVINFALGDLKEQYTRGFRSTAGYYRRAGYLSRRQLTVVSVFQRQPGHIPAAK